MAVKRVSKQALIGETILFVNSDKENEFESISPSFMSNQIDIISLSAFGGSPILPTAGEYSVFVKTDVDGSFKRITENSTIEANLTGGSLMSDGVGLSGNFVGLPLEIKIVPSGVVGANAYRVLIKQSSQQTSISPPSITQDFLIEVGKGNVPGHSFQTIVGHNDSVSDSNFDDVWGGGGNMILPTAAEELEIVSDDPRDTDGGDGARTVLITTLDSNLDPLTPQEVTLNGTTPVTIPLGIAHFRMDHLTPTSGGFVLTAGDVSVNPPESNIGTLTIRAVGAGLVRSVIMPTVGKTEDWHVTPKAGFSIFGLRNLLVWPKDQSGEVVLTLKLRSANSARISTGIIPIYQSPVNIIFEAKNRGTSALDRAIRAKSTNPNKSLTVVTEYLVVDDDFL